MLRLLPLLALLACPALGQEHFWGACPTPTLPATTATAAALAANPWYEQRRYYSWLEGHDRCVNWAYTASGGGLVAVTSMTRHASTPITMESRLVYRGTPPYPRFYYSQTKLPGTHIPLPGTYDYRIVVYNANYVVAWSCRQHWFSHEQMLWVMTKDKNPATSVVTSALDAVTTAGLTVDNRRLMTVRQDC